MLLDELEYDYKWKVTKEAGSLSIRKGSYLDSPYYIVEIVESCEESLRKSTLHFVPQDFFENTKDFISQICEQEDAWEAIATFSDFEMDCITICSNELESKELQILFDEYEDTDELILATRKKGRKYYKIYEVEKDILLDYDFDEVTETLQDFYDIDLLAEQEDVLSFLDIGLLAGSVYFWYRIFNS